MQIVSLQHMLAIPVNSRISPLLFPLPKHSHFPCVPFLPFSFSLPLQNQLKISFLQEAFSEKPPQPQPRPGSLSLGLPQSLVNPYVENAILIHEHMFTCLASHHIISFTRMVIYRICSTQSGAWHAVGHQYLHKTECIGTLSVEVVFTNVFEESFVSECLLTFKNGEPIRDGQLAQILTWI